MLRNQRPFRTTWGNIGFCQEAEGAGEPPRVFILLSACSGKIGPAAQAVLGCLVSDPGD